MTRYFMTIPEAVSLVLQAGAMADKRKVFELEMGQPVKIIELARQMIRLAGHRPDEDIKIEIVGTRPGERLHEYLHDDAEIVEPTWHPSIRGLTPKVADRPDHACRTSSTCGAAAAPARTSRSSSACSTRCSPSAASSATSTPTSHAPHRLADDAAPTSRLAAAPTIIDLTGVDRTDARRAGARRCPRCSAAGPRSRPACRSSGPSRPPLERVMQRLEPSYKRGMLTNGPLVAELEARIAERLGVAHVVALSSCTSGLMLVVQALTDGRPGPVVLPSFTFSASAHAVAWNGRTPALRRVLCPTRSRSIPRDTAAPARRARARSWRRTCSVRRATRARARRARRRARHPAHLRRRARARRRASTASRSARSATPRCSASRPPSRSSPAKAASSRPTTPRSPRRCASAATTATPATTTRASPGSTRACRSSTRRWRSSRSNGFDESLDRRRYLAGLYRGVPRRRPGHRVPGVLGARHEHVQGPHDQGRRRPRSASSRDGLALALLAEGVDTRKYFDPPVHRQRAYGAPRVPPRCP